MAVVNLPDSPANGTTQTVGGITYTYNSSKGYWTADASSGGGGGGGASVTTDDSAPGSPSDGDLWYDTDDGGMFVYYEDADSSQWVEVIGSQGAAGAAGAAGADGGAGVASVYATVDNLPTSGNSQGDMAHVTANNTLYFWNGSGWYKIALINTNPSISGVSSSYTLATDGTATTVTMTATDPEGLPITYSIASDTSGNTATVAQGSGASSNVFTVTPSTNTAYAGSFTLTFRASDGVNLATAPATFTLQFSVENSNYTTALITSVGANNADNNDFVDSSTNSYTITAAGNAHQTTFSPYRHGGYSTYFDGSGDYLNVPYTASNFGTSDFTLEAWVYNTVQDGANYNVIFDTRSGATGNAFVFGITASSYAYYYDGAEYATSTAVPLNQWAHLAIVRSGSTVKIYQDGVEVLSRADSSNLTGTSTGQITIGRAVQGAAHFNGYLTDVRIVKGTAVYTSAFTPPTERLTAITNTSLLTCHLPYIADGSTNGHTITVTGDTSTQPFSPYDYLSYNEDNNGGSVYLDGSGDYLSTTLTTPVGSSDYQAELWAYVHSNSTWAGLMACRTGDTSADWLFGINRSVAYGIYLYVGNHLFNSGNTHIPLKQWVHLVLTREGNNGKIFMNGKQIASTTSYTASTYNHTNTAFTIGAGRSNGTETIHANIADARLKVGSGSVTYTSDFTPPTSPSTTTSDSQVHVKSTNAGIIDKAQGGKVILLQGDAKCSTEQTKFLSSSMKFDGSDRINVGILNDNGGVFAMRTQDFTWETWAYLGSGMSSYHHMISSRPSNTGGTEQGGLSINPSGGITFYAGAFVINYTTSIGTGSWKHIALVRDGSNIRVFVDGIQVAINTSYTSDLTRDDLTLGANYNGTEAFIGYLSDVRITKGLARYTSNFTPPTAALQG